MRNQHQLKQLRRWRIRKKISGTSEIPRMAVCFTAANIHVQFIDDAAGRTLAAATTAVKSDSVKLRNNIAGAKEIGKVAATRAIDKGIKQVVFDRGGKRYHGRVKALADAAREAGLKF